jgi:hypothetical protein
MKITVNHIKENADGSGDCQIEFDQEGRDVLIQWGFVAILTKAVGAYAIRPEESSDVVARARRLVE